MPDFAAALAQMHGAVLTHIGQAASFQPADGPAIQVRAELMAPDAIAGLIEARGVTPSARLAVLAAALPRAPRIGETFALPGKTWRVIAAPRFEDDDRLVWTLDVE